MNILLINNIYNEGSHLTTGGVEYHRMIKPHTVLRRLHPEFDYVMTNSLDNIHDTLLDQTDLVLFSRSISMLPFIDRIAERIEQKNIPIGLDLDDYWHLPDYHVSYEVYKEHKFTEAVEKSIQKSSFVICTTPILADKIKPLNAEVHVIENGIDLEDEVWKPNKSESKRLRFGFTQGNTHFEDIQLITNKIDQSYKDVKFYHNAQIVLTGYTSTSTLNPNIGMAYEMALTDKYKALKHSPEYLAALKADLDLKAENYPYRRIYGKDVLEYAKIYDDIDVSVVPLISNEFNSCKSELKMLEAAAKDCAVIVSHVAPYTLLATDKNSFDLNKRNFFEWQRYLLNNQNAIEDSKEQLKLDTVRYDLRLLTNKRLNLYKKYERINSDGSVQHAGESKG